MNVPLTTENLTYGEKVGFGIATIGTTILLILTVKSSIESGVAPQIEQKIFGLVFIATLAVLGGVVISHYTTFFGKLFQKFKSNSETETESEE